LSQELETHLGEVLHLDNGYCVSAGSGTAAITAALIAVAGRAKPGRPYCLMPSYTFVATAIAALNAGYTPYLVDVDFETFALQPGQLIGHPALSKAGAVIAVAPYGGVVDTPAWGRLSKACGVPVLIDAAASLDSFASGRSRLDGRTPVILSLHATKAFGAGEGGAILCGNADLANACRRALNFGFLGDRIASADGINGKMSEYHAAVGLAELEGWPTKRASFLRVAEAYQRAANACLLPGRVLAECGYATGYVLFLAETVADAFAVRDRLSAVRIDHRFWYGEGLHRQPAYTSCPADALPVTESLAPRLIGLPCSVDLAEGAVAKVIAALAGRT
jgi:dTDP-4-amino-4,6-dideoxygalactose transaminase